MGAAVPEHVCGIVNAWAAGLTREFCTTWFHVRLLCSSEEVMQNFTNKSIFPPVLFRHRHPRSRSEWAVMDYVLWTFSQNYGCCSLYRDVQLISVCISSSCLVKEIYKEITRVSKSTKKKFLWETKWDCRTKLDCETNILHSEITGKPADLTVSVVLWSNMIYKK